MVMSYKRNILILLILLPFSTLLFGLNLTDSSTAYVHLYPAIFKLFTITGREVETIHYVKYVLLVLFQVTLYLLWFFYLKKTPWFTFYILVCPVLFLITYIWCEAIAIFFYPLVSLTLLPFITIWITILIKMAKAQNDKI